MEQTLETQAQKDRILVIDLMKGIVMILMALDHAGIVFNGAREARDGWAYYRSHLPIDSVAFATRSLTHICAPTFLFLAGLAGSLSYERKCRSNAADQTRFDRDLLIRGLLFLALDLVWWGRWWLEVLYPFGIAYLSLIVFRRCPRWMVLLAGMAMVLGAEIPLLMAREVYGGDLESLRQFLFNGGDEGSFWRTAFLLVAHPGSPLELGPVRLTVLYPALPWVGVFLLGWATGPFWFQGGRPDDVRQSVIRLAVAGGVSLIAFLMIRGLDGYGNMLLGRYDGSLVQWMHVSKYPPSLSFLSLELGLMGLVLAALLFYQPRLDGTPSLGRKVLVVFGRNPLIFYLLHMHIMKVVAILFGWRLQGGVVAQYAAAILVLPVMYGVCRAHSRLKSTGRWPWLRYF